MPQVHEYMYAPPQPRPSSHALASATLEERFELLKEIGDGSFGSVALARVRTAGAHIARRGTLVAVKTMKKSFDSFTPCLELREIIFLRTVPHHIHLVPALDIFLDPLSRKLHICMENMDGNLYQLMKSRDHKCLDPSSVKSILYQILAGLAHIHAHQFFHRDIKPENILVSTSAPQDSHHHSNTFRRYSAMITPPSTPPTYSVKIADFGLAREIHSSSPYTTYVSTRWYRAPEVLLRAGEYSAPVDMWALGAMAVEIANLKPLFPGGNEVDQVWRVCEIMGSPGNWHDKAGNRVGGGEWREGTRLAQRLGFSFPKMAPHSMEYILRPPLWPSTFSNFVTWCLMWDPRHRPTSTEALRHEYFADAVDPLRPKSSRMLGKKQTDGRASRDSTTDSHATANKQSWFRRSLIKDPSFIVPVLAAESTANAPEEPQQQQVQAGAQQSTHQPQKSVGSTDQGQPESMAPPKYKPFSNKRATWNSGAALNAAPMPILPSIRPVTPFSAAVHAQARNDQRAAPVRQDGPSSLPRQDAPVSNPPVRQDASVTLPRQDALPAPPSNLPAVKPGRKIGRQLSVQSQSNHYAELAAQRPDASERTVVPSAGSRGPQSPTTESKESFFSHLRKRARRFSGKPLGANMLVVEDLEGAATKSVVLDTAPHKSRVLEGMGNKSGTLEGAAANKSPVQSTRSSMVIDSNIDSVLNAKTSGEAERGHSLGSHTQAQTQHPQIQTVPSQQQQRSTHQTQTQHQQRSVVQPGAEAGPTGHSAAPRVPTNTSTRIHTDPTLSTQHRAHHQTLPKSVSASAIETSSAPPANPLGPISSRTRRALLHHGNIAPQHPHKAGHSSANLQSKAGGHHQHQTHPASHHRTHKSSGQHSPGAHRVSHSNTRVYDTPDEEDELLHEVLTSAHMARSTMERAALAEAEEEYNCRRSSSAALLSSSSSTGGQATAGASARVGGMGLVTPTSPSPYAYPLQNQGQTRRPHPQQVPQVLHSQQQQQQQQQQQRQAPPVYAVQAQTPNVQSVQGKRQAYLFDQAPRLVTNIATNSPVTNMLEKSGSGRRKNASPPPQQPTPPPQPTTHGGTPASITPTVAAVTPNITAAAAAAAAAASGVTEATRAMGSVTGSGIAGGMVPPRWPTPPYDDHEWAAAAAASIFAAGSNI